MPDLLHIICMSSDDSTGDGGRLQCCRLKKVYAAGGDIKSIREYALQQPYREDPPIDHPVARVRHREGPSDHLGGALDCSSHDMMCVGGLSDLCDM